MNSRERIITTLNHKEPDKVPIDLNSNSTTALTKKAYQNLRNYLNLKEDKTLDISDSIQGTVRAKEDILSIYEIDTRTVFLKDSQLTTIKILPDGSFYDSYGVRWKPASYYFDAVERPLSNINKVSDLKKIKWEDLHDKTIARDIKNDAEDLYRNTDYCLVADHVCWGPFEGACVFCGYEKFLIDIYFNRKFVLALLDKITETAIAKYEILLNEVGNYIQVVSFGDDVAMQTSSYISPQMYRKFIKPLHKKIFNFIRTKTKAKIFYHVCGAVYKLIPDFIDIGVDILNPVQRSAAGMNIIKLKKEFGKSICFWGGGIDIQKQLPFYSLKEIEKEIKKTLEIMAPGGGYVFFPTHNIQADVTPDRIDCMFKSVIKYRKYKV